jgi:hypothetical protein
MGERSWAKAMQLGIACNKEITAVKIQAYKDLMVEDQ